MRFSEYQRLRFEPRDNGVLLITLDRPEKYTAHQDQHAG
jgi:enoyl-CoA hydratase